MVHIGVDGVETCFWCLLARIGDAFYAVCKTVGPYSHRNVINMPDEGNLRTSI